jgi:hypothetical protein
MLQRADRIAAEKKPSDIGSREAVARAGGVHDGPRQRGRIDDGVAVDGVKPGA